MTFSGGLLSGWLRGFGLWVWACLEGGGWENLVMSLSIGLVFWVSRFVIAGLGLGFLSSFASNGFPTSISFTGLNLFITVHNPSSNPGFGPSNGWSVFA